LEALNTPIAVLAVFLVVVALNSFLFFGYYLPRTTTTAPASPQIERIPPSTTVERTSPPTTIEEETTTSIY
jgi:hypothetical protein